MHRIAESRLGPGTDSERLIASTDSNITTRSSCSLSRERKTSTEVAEAAAAAAAAAVFGDGVSFANLLGISSGITGSYNYSRNKTTFMSPFEDNEPPLWHNVM